MRRLALVLLLLASMAFTSCGSGGGGGQLLPLILLAGGEGANFDVLNSAEIYNPRTRAFSAVGNMNQARFRPASSLVRGGAVLLAGGFGPGPSFDVLDSAELYDPARRSFTLLASHMAQPRLQATGTTLDDGRVLIAGGTGELCSDTLDTAEIFSFPGETFTATAGPMNSKRYGHTATKLSGGTVLLAGGADASCVALNTAEIFNPNTGTFTPTAGLMNVARFEHTATLIGNKVLIAGGQSCGDCGAPTRFESAEIFDPATGLFTLTTDLGGTVMTKARAAHTATLLSSGKVLLAGGKGPAAATAELFDPATKNFTATAGGLNTPRFRHGAALLPDGTVLVAGGNNNSFAIFNTAEIFDPGTGMFTLLPETMTEPRRGQETVRYVSP